MKPPQEPSFWRSNTPTLQAWARAAARGGAALGRALIAVLRPLGWLLARPTVVGAAYLLAVTAATASGPLIDETERALGHDTARVEAWVHVRFARTILAFAGTLALTSLAIGACLGGLAGAWLALRRRAAGRPPMHRAALLVATLALTATAHAVVTLVAMAWTPQLYADAFFGAGGWRASLQTFVTDRLGARATTWVALGSLTLLAPPPWWWPSIARRAVVAWRAAIARRPPFALLGAVTCGCVAIGVLVFARPGPVASRGASSSPNVLVLAADSFRDEGLRPEVMPRLSALAEHGVRFTNAYVSMARTLSSWTTFLTGRYAHHHGIRSMFPRWEDHASDLDTLPRRLARAGYRTAVVSDYVGDAFNTVDLGFEDVLAPRLDAGEIIRAKGFARAWPLLPFLHSSAGRRVFPTLREMRECADASLLARDAVGALRAMRASPFFLTVFFGASHAPYAAPAPYYRRFTDPAYTGRNRYHKSRWFTADELATSGKAALNEAAHVHGLYEGALASVDDGAGRVLDELDRLGLTDSTIVVVLGDHGENLADAPGRYYGHGNHLFGDHDLHVPLVIVDPRRPGGRAEPGVVTNADLAPTLFELTGVAPPAAMDGASLVPALAGAAIAPRPTFAETELWIGVQPDLPDRLRFPYPEFLEYSEVDSAHGDALVLKREFGTLTLVARHRMVRDGAWKLLYMPTAKGVVYELFDTDTDPENLTDLAVARPEVTARLKEELWAWMLEDRAMEERRGYLAPKGVRVPEIDGAP
jgi:arylsulfatase A-like enzyme